MTQIQEPIPIVHNDAFIPQMNPNLNFMNQMNISQMMPPPPINMQINNNFPMSVPYQMQNVPNNNIQNQQNIDQSNYIFF